MISGEALIEKRDAKSKAIEQSLFLSISSYYSKFLREVNANISKADKTCKIMKKDLNDEMIDLILPSQAEKLDEFLKLIAPILLLGYKDSFESMGGTFSQNNTYIQKSLNIEKSLFNNMMANTFLTLRLSLRDAIGRNLPFDEIREIMGKTLDKNQAKARLISKTESMRTANVGIYAATVVDNEVQGYEWVAVMDRVTREHHAEVNGERIEKGGYFSNGLQYPLDPNGPPEEVCNCRCIAIPLRKV